MKNLNDIQRWKVKILKIRHHKMKNIAKKYPQIMDFDFIGENYGNYLSYFEYRSTVLFYDWDDHDIIEYILKQPISTSHGRYNMSNHPSKAVHSYQNMNK